MKLIAHLRSKIPFLLLSCLLVLCTTSTYGGKSKLLQGVQGSDVTAGTVLSIKDPYFNSILTAGSPTVPGQFRLAESEARLSLRLDETSGEYHASPWQLVVDYEVTYEQHSNLGNPITLANQSLVINYAPTGSYSDKALQRFTDAIYAQVTVTGVTFKDLNGVVISKTMPQDVYLDLEYHAVRHHQLDLNTAPQLRTELVSNLFNGTPVTNQMELSWSFVRGAEYFELEYLFVETGTIDPVTTPVPYSWKDATRISLSDNHYLLNLAFPEGALLYRVRAIGQFDGSTQPGRKEGAWSYAPATLTTQQAFADNDAQYHNIARDMADGLLPEMNWQYSAGFAEDGKRKEVIGFFDGSQRGRQQLTLINTEQHALVGESVYDHQGRATVNILPVPVNSLGLGYYSGNNTTLNGGFDRNSFDTDRRTNPNDPNFTGSLPLPANSATSTYYSGNNPLSFELRDLIPEANGYAYTQAIPTNDGTGRLRSQSGIGQTFSNANLDERTTSFFYSKPTQYQLNRLFGSEVGYARFYQKNLTKDPNGQVSVAYTDQAGRTIATALNGTGAANLLELDDKPPAVIITEDLLKEGQEPNQDGDLEATFFIEVINPQTFSYTLDYDLNGADACIGCLSYCETCKYDYRITIKHPDNPNYFYDSGWQLGQSNAAAAPVTFNNFPVPGVYKLVKTMRPSVSAAAAFRKKLYNDVMADLYGTSQTCVVLETANPEDCNPSCTDLCAQAYIGSDGSGTTRYYDADMNWQNTSGVAYTASSPEHLNAIADCEANCDAPQYFTNSLCDIRLEALKQDMSPGGQYFDNLPAKYEKDINGLYVINTDGDRVIVSNYTSSVRQQWLNNYPISGGLLNGFNFDAGTSFSSWDDVRNNWDDAYADILATYHPEYCRYQALCLNDIVCDGASATMDDVNHYVTLMMQGDDDAYAFSSTNGHNYNFFNPLGQPKDLTPINNSLYCFADDVDGGGAAYAQAPLAVVACKETDIANYLRGYLSFTKTNGLAETYSIWYVLDDPLGIATGNGPANNIPQTVIDIFQAFHGNGTTPGLIGSNTGQVSKYQFFRSTYLFFRDLVLYEHANAFTCGNSSWQAYHNTDGDFDGLTDADGFQLLFPPNPIYENYSSPTTIGTTMTTVTCAQNCTAFAADWMAQLADCITAAGLNSAQQASLRNDLIEVCKAGCDASNQFQGTSVTPSGLTCYVTGGQTFCDFDAVIAFHLSACTTSVVHPAPSYEPEDCHCGPLQDYIVANNLVAGSNPLTPTSAELTAITNHINLEGWNGTPYPESEVESWLKHCRGEAGNIDESYPEELECTVCKCGELLDFIDQNDLAADINVILTSEHQGIADALNAALTTPAYTASFTANDIATWLFECGQSDPNETLFGNFPQELDCPIAPGPVVNLDSLALMLCQDELARIDEINKRRRFTRKLLELAEKTYQDYLTTCRNSANEALNATYPLDEFYYTLYYYDQAGNLVKTIAPREVDPSQGFTVSDQVNADRTADNGSLTHPAHEAVTRYRYNGLNQVVEQSTPDGGTTFFWYNRIGQLVASQSARQEEMSTPGSFVYSYSNYDALGRVIEAGEMTSLTDLSALAYDVLEGTLNSGLWPANLANTRREVTRTFYDQSPGNIAQLINGGQRYSRNRIASVTFEQVYDPDPTIYDQASHYNYDIHGNVNTLLQENRELATLGQEFKQIDYTYDLISGNVHEVAVQRGERDQFFHRYRYDADNRITQAWTSADGIIWEREAKYFYYPHGPLARTELGDRQVQATDHAYTLQGWLKSANANTLTPNRDPGKDGNQTANNLNQHFGTDAFGFSLHYFEGDYDHIGNAPSHLAATTGSAFLSASTDLFNGNIAQMVTALSDHNQEALPVHGANYRYDQLNRIKSAHFWKDNTPNTDAVAANHSFASATDNGDYQTAYKYDFNGNITNLTRFTSGIGSGPYIADQFTYRYNPDHTNNRLRHVNDAGGTDTTWNDLEDQGSYIDTDPSSWNYNYDASGNLIQDKAEEIEQIIWSVTGKVNQVIRTATSTKPDLEFIYDPLGNRIGKTVKGKDAAGNLLPPDTWEHSWYLRDAQGNHLSTYATTGDTPSEVLLEDQLIYGSKRLGSRQLFTDITSTNYGDGEITISGDNVSCAPTELVIYVDGVAINAPIPYTAATVRNDIVNAINGYTSVPNYNAAAVTGTPLSLTIQAIDCPNTVGLISSSAATATCGNWNITVANQVGMCPTNNLKLDRTLGSKRYELSNHLGNVLETISDRKLAIDDNTDNLVDVYTADVASFSDYLPFGSLMPGRHGGSSSRFGFNGAEKDDEIKGDGNHYDLGLRNYDPRLGRMMSRDPRAPEYPWQTPYAYHRNNPINVVDHLGGGDPPGPLYHNTARGDQIIKDGFNATTFGEKSNYNWFTTVKEDPTTGVKAEGTLEVRGLNTSNAHVITEAQTKTWSAEAMTEMGYTKESWKEAQKVMTKEAFKALENERRGRMWSKVGEYMDNMKKDVYLIEKNGHFAVSDKAANVPEVKIHQMSGKGTKSWIKNLNGTKIAGRTLVITAIAMDVYRISTSQNVAKTTTKVVTGWAGASIGASTMMTAAAVGGQLGPQVLTPEEIVTVPLAGLVGGIVGFWWGEGIAETTYELLETQGWVPGGKE